MTANRPLRAVLLLSALLALAGCATASVSGGGGQSISEAQAERYDGPKARIAVSRFTNKSGGRGWTSSIGDGMSDMTATALFNTNRYIVLERGAGIKDVMAEQDLGRSGRVRKETAAAVGELEGAELLVTGAVTEFAPQTSGVGAATSIRNSVVSGIAGGLKQSRVAIDVRVLDARTGRIVSASTVVGQAADLDLSRVSVVTRTVSSNLGAFAHTPMEKAIRIAVDEAVKFVVSKTPAEYYRHP